MRLGLRRGAAPGASAPRRDRVGGPRGDGDRGGRGGSQGSHVRRSGRNPAGNRPGNRPAIWPAIGRPSSPIAAVGAPRRLPSARLTTRWMHEEGGGLNLAKRAPRLAGPGRAQASAALFASVWPDARGTMSAQLSEAPNNRERVKLPAAPPHTPPVRGPRRAHCRDRRPSRAAGPGRARQGRCAPGREAPRDVWVRTHPWQPLAAIQWEKQSGGRSRAGRAAPRAASTDDGGTLSAATARTRNRLLNIIALARWL